MKCSACKARLPAYLDNDLSDREARAVAEHMASCAACRAQADSLRAVELRLSRVRGIEPHVDFTLSVMARIATMPAPVARRLNLWPIALYVPAAWAALIALFATRVLNWQGVSAGLSLGVAKAGIAAQTLFNVGEHFNVVAMAAAGAVLEIALLALAVAVARIYFGKLPALPGWMSGARA